MKSLLGFIKTTALGGLVVIVPLGIVYLALTEITDMLGEFAATPAGYLPFAPAISVIIVLLLMLLLVLIICFAIGLFLKTQFGDRIKLSIETRLENAIPMYGMLRNLTQRLVGIEGMQLSPAEIDLYGSDARVIGFIVEELPGDRFSVFVPISPLITVGNVYILPRTKVRKLDASLTDTVNYFSQWGLEAGKLGA
jgi:uncharacterized membrane protein